MAGLALLGVFGQSLLGARMATSWAAQRCLAGGEACRWLVWHRSTATPVALLVLGFVITAFLIRGWSRRQWPFLLGVVLLLSTQIALGVLTLRLGLAQPLVTVSHQLVAALLVALLSALMARTPQALPSRSPAVLEDTTLEPCHG